MRLSNFLLHLIVTFPLCSLGKLIPSLLDATIDDLAGLLDEGIVTSVELVQAYISRINEVNDELLAIMEINPDAIASAYEADEERRLASHHDIPLGPLHGIPILIKDNIATFNNNNTAGSVCMLGAVIKAESPLITRLRKAGAIILGKANMSEWAGARSGWTNATIGWSGYGGQCRAAYIKDQSPSSSSSGSAVAVSIGLAPVALGTETDGSIISPSDKSNLVGLKPSRGLTSRSGVIPLTHRQDTVGPMCKTVSDCARVLSVIAGKDPKDNYTSLQPFDTLPDYTRFLNASALSGVRLGIPWNMLDHIAEGNSSWASPTQVQYLRTVFNASLAILEEAGATLVSANYTFLNTTYNEFTSWRDGNTTIIWQADMLSSIKFYLDDLEVRPPGINTIEDIINCTKHDPRERYPEVDMGSWDAMLEHTRPADSAEVWEAYQHSLRLAGDGAVFGAIDAYDLDALVLPSFPAFDMCATIGAPVITVPMGVFGDDIDITWDPRHELKWIAVSQ